MFKALAFATTFALSALPALAQSMSPDQIREEQAYAAGVQTAIWGRPFVDIVRTFAAGLESNGVGLNYFRKYSDLKTAADRFVNTPNNVSIDAYGVMDLSIEPMVVSVPAHG